KAMGMWLRFTILGLWGASWLSRSLKMLKDRIMIAMMSFALALFLAGLFEKSGLAMIIGAYVMGLSLSKTDLTYMVQDQLSGMYRFFVPIFFCVMGMLIDVQAMLSPTVIKFGMVYIVLAVISKVIGCSLPALLFRFNFIGALRVGVGMVPRGEVALIIAGIGLSSGFLTNEIFNVAMIMTFMTTLITPPILDRLISLPQSSLRKEVKSNNITKEIRFEMPNMETTELVLDNVIQEFESEGFYIHHLEYPERIFYIRKDSTFITLKIDEPDLIFDCSIQDEAFIHTLFYEVVADMERLMERLQRLADKEQIGKNIFKNGTGEGLNNNYQKKMQQTFSPLAVEVDLKAGTKEEVICRLINLLTRSGELSTSREEEVFEDVMDRENSVSTGLQDGVAFPHARTHAVKKLIVAVGLINEGVDFQSLDQKPSKIFILTLAPKSDPQPYLQFISQISQLLTNAHYREKLLSCRTNDELYKLLCGQN
ncbi:MAG: PTS sugar transporter subunit IIA, partial [Candidatus Omnitrophica bacterium]|nr:PTS sugar transporter subunit IIA [Candidatus Omnitrophota bacterium]